MSKSIDEIPEADRPREKLLSKCAPALSDQELLGQPSTLLAGVPLFPEVSVRTFPR